MKTVIIVGGRNPEGQTARAVAAVGNGIRAGGHQAETVFLPPLRIERCRQCEDSGWGLCRKEGRCVITDDFAAVVEQIRAANAAVFATPVYYSDLSESLRAFLDRLRRICTQPEGRKGIDGKPVVGVCVAGGGGGGGAACCVSLEKVMANCGFSVIDMVPVRRQNLQAKLDCLEHAGTELAKAGV